MDIEVVGRNGLVVQLIAPYGTLPLPHLGLTLLLHALQHVFYLKVSLPTERGQRRETRKTRASMLRPSLLSSLTDTMLQRFGLRISSLRLVSDCRIHPIETRVVLLYSFAEQGVRSKAPTADSGLLF